MNANEIQAAAERVRRFNASQTDVAALGPRGAYEQLQDDRRILADAYLAERDEGAVTEEWLRELGFKDWKPTDDDEWGGALFIRANDEIGWECRLVYLANGFYLMRMGDPNEGDDEYASESVELFNSRNRTKVVTRGQLLALLRALGIEAQLSSEVKQ